MARQARSCSGDAAGEGFEPGLGDEGIDKADDQAQVVLAELGEGRLQSRAPIIGRNSKLFGVGHGKGILNFAGNRLGWGKGPGHELIFRVAVRGSHNNVTLLRSGARFS